MFKPILMLFFGICAFMFQEAHSQKVYRSEQFTFSKDSLTGIYYEAVLMDPAPVFDVGTEVFMAEWSKFVRTMGRYLYDQHFQWGTPVKGNLEVYFGANGKIELMSISLRDRQMSEEQWKLLLKLLNQFATEYKFTIAPKAAFSNMGSFQYAD